MPKELQLQWMAGRLVPLSHTLQSRHTILMMSGTCKTLSYTQEHSMRPTQDKIWHLYWVMFFREWKTEEKKPVLVTDNAKNMILAGASAEMKPHVWCIAHTLNLSSQKARKVDTVSALLVKIRKLVTFFQKSPKACEALYEMQIQLHLKHLKLVHDVSMRWNSSLEMMGHSGNSSLLWCWQGR